MLPTIQDALVRAEILPSEDERIENKMADMYDTAMKEIQRVEGNVEYVYTQQEESKLRFQQEVRTLQAKIDRFLPARDCPGSHEVPDVVLCEPHRYQNQVD